MSIVILGNAKHLINLADHKGLTEEACDDLVQTGLQADLYEAAVVGKLKRGDRFAFRQLLGLVAKICKIVVDYTMTLEQMVIAGCYDLVDLNITPDLFEVEGEGQVELEPELVHFGHDRSSEVVLAELEKRGLRPGTLAELLAFGATCPEVQQEFLVVALGSSAEVCGDRRVPFLDGNDSRRVLSLGWFEDGWGGNCRFLAFRK